MTQKLIYEKMTVDFFEKEANRLEMFLVVSAVVIFSSIFLVKISDRAGIPVLLAFILLGMVFGKDGLFKIPFNNFETAERICTVALIYIMFYGGFSTNWKEAKSTVKQAAILSTLGVAATAAFVALFCRFVLKMSGAVSFVMGAVISSTDAASVFSILRSKRLNLRDSTAPLLEVESGSNDPAAFMFTLIGISLLEGKINGFDTVVMMLKQVGIGAVAGVAFAYAAKTVLRKVDLSRGGYSFIFLVGISTLAYALPAILGGNGYLSAYICGIILGNSRFRDKTNVVHSMESLTSLMQIIIFFLLGLLATPTRLPGSFLRGLAVFLFLTFVARPAAVFLLLIPFKMSIRQKTLISFVGLRGAAAIVFAIMTVTSTTLGASFIFDTTFVIVLLSILFQGSLLPFVSRSLKMIDDEGVDVMKTFTDYTRDLPVQFIKMRIPKKHSWNGKMIQDIDFPPETLAVLVERDKNTIIPNGGTKLLEGDKVVLSGLTSENVTSVGLVEALADEASGLIGLKVQEACPSDHALVTMIIRDHGIIIPKGTDIIQKNDILVMTDS